MQFYFIIIFVNSIIYKTALDYAKGKDHLLMKEVGQVTNVNDPISISIPKTPTSKQENQNIIPSK